MNTIRTYTKQLIGLIACMAAFHSSFAQSKARIENIDFYAEGANLVVTYDIVKAEAGETFNIWMKVTTVSGKEIIPSSVSGDVGNGVTGGPNKRILWDMQSDNAQINEEIEVEVLARSDQSEASKTEKEKEPKAKTEKSGISVGGAMVVSALLPGLGRTLAKGGGSQWLLGVVGYGCVAGTIVMNNMAYNAYEDYKISLTTEDRDDNFKKAENFELYSKIFLGAAATIWVIDIIATGVVASKERKKSNKGFSLNYSFDPYSGTPLMGFSYSF
ncbi:MAG: hypothetical protein JW731_11445 [Bacteroidales bacterium]|nr:hypothetical protein [Bacteroidales bacterium]